MDDERQVELDCITAIFPEIQIDHENPLAAIIELPVHPTNPVKVVFPAVADFTRLTPPAPPSFENEASVLEHAETLEIHSLSYLPSLQIRITLPEGYPENVPPKFELSTVPGWLSEKKLYNLQENAHTLWEEAGRSMVVYSYIDSLQQAAENAFGYAEAGMILAVPQHLKISLLDYEMKATQAAFEQETFNCGVCLDPKKGLVCHQMIDCGHVFCVACLQDYYSNAIDEGDLSSVRCLAPNCAKKRGQFQVTSKKYRKPKTQLGPSELLQIPLSQDVVTRYVKLKHKAELESDKNTIYCPRKWCQGAARSKKHRKTQSFRDEASGDEESDDENGKLSKFVAGELLSVCEDCSFAFCSRCFQGWHGEFTLCTPKKATGELTEEDKASIQYLKMHTTPCPTCSAPSQKTHGCNHLICFKCQTHFCYLCSAWLSPANPYKHYNEERIGCYMRLWELEEGDGDDVGILYAGRRRVEALEGLIDMAEEIEIPADLVPAAVPAQAAPEVAAIAPVPQQQLQREGPLVLRINHIPPPPAPAPGIPGLRRS